MKPIRLGIAGCGYIAQKEYFPVLADEEIRNKVEVTAICDVVPGRADEICERYQFGRSYTDYAQMLRESDLDLIAILTPIPLHFEQAKLALKAGCHVYVQKTMTTLYSEALELNRLAKEQELLIGASPGRMLDYCHQEAKKLLDSGEIGKVCFIRGQGAHPGHEHDDSFGINPSWYYKPGGGPLLDVAVYPLTSITGILGPAKRVTAFSGIAIPERYWQGNRIDVQMDDNTAMLLDFGEGILASIQGNFVSRSFNTPQIEMYGASGVLQIGGWTRKQVPLEVFTVGKGWRSIDPIQENVPKGVAMNHTLIDLMHMIDCLRDGNSLQISGEHAAHVIEIIEKAYESARTGLALPLESVFAV